MAGDPLFEHLQSVHVAPAILRKMHPFGDLDQECGDVAARRSSDLRRLDLGLVQHSGCLLSSVIDELAVPQLELLIIFFCVESLLFHQQKLLCQRRLC